ncbi:MAG: hypothetical protein QOF30_2055, partial [Acidimicrobiaceae bacterium]|nr:hypothetical protein [Acidimicrobiaceae bacterium]
FVVIEVLVQPGSGYVGHTSTPAKIGVFILYVLFALGTVAFWAFFRFRPARVPSLPNEDDLQAEGEFDVR